MDCGKKVLFSKAQIFLPHLDLITTSTSITIFYASPSMAQSKPSARRRRTSSSAPSSTSNGSASLTAPILATTASEWPLILALIFGGCCSNAYTLELATRQLPSSGTLITFAQFLITTLSTLPQFLIFTTTFPFFGLKDRKVPLWRWAVQVGFYLTTSLLNNWAFGYDVPMPVHIVFRSGGLVVNMILGWAVQKRKYSLLQVASVVLVTVGVVSSTIHTAGSGGGEGVEVGEVGKYATGVVYLFSALVLSGLMGLWQERTFALYGNQNWRESLFYSHLLSLPLFLLHPSHLVNDIKAANATPSYHLSKDIRIPNFYPPLLLNVATQLLCINGVNRLTSKVSSLSVTLVLVVRKAVSLIISVMLVQRSSGSLQLWLGAGAVLAGTVGYSLSKPPVQAKPKDKTQ